jgi:RNA polymerase primary sigma factor
MVLMAEKFDDEEITGDFVREYVRLTWLADYFDGDESHPTLDDLEEDFFGMHPILVDEFGKEVIPDEDENQDSLAPDDEDEDFSVDDDEEVEDLEWDETYQSRVLSRLSNPVHKWQESALEKWELNNHTGIVEAVTGSGKTFLGIIATAKALDDGLGVVIVVPTRVLQEQWIDEINHYFAKEDEEFARVVGGLGGEYGSNLNRKASMPMERQIVVAVAATFSAKEYFHPEADESMLLIADEVHRYSGELHSRIFHENFERRLGLTATFEPVLGRYSLYEGYFGKSPLFEYSFKDAIQDDVVSEYDVVLVRVILPPQLKNEYDRLWLKTKAIEDKLRFFTRISFAPEKVHREISQLKENNQYLELVTEWENLNDELDTLLSNKATKESTIRILAPYIERWGHTVIFTDYVPLAEQLQTILIINGVYSKLLDSKVRQNERREAFNYFEDGRVKSLVSPRVLDEGVNLPLLSFGIFAGVRRRRLQLVQRLGRVLRKDLNKTWPLICIPVNIDTFEDPLLAGNEKLPYSPLNIILENASKVAVVDAKNEVAVKAAFDFYDGSSEE